jgi:hypothetical protein
LIRPGWCPACGIRLGSWKPARLKMKLRVFCDVLPCSYLDVDRRFRGSCCLHYRPDDGGSTNLWNVGRHSIKNTAVHPRRFCASYSPPWELEISHRKYISWLRREVFAKRVYLVLFYLFNQLK